MLPFGSICQNRDDESFIHRKDDDKPKNCACLDNVETTNEFTANIELWISWPAGERLQTLSNLFIFENIEMIVFYTATKVKGKNKLTRFI